MLLDGCDDTCGWIAAVIAALAYGTYGVPVKESFRMKKKAAVTPAAAIDRICTNDTLSSDNNDSADIELKKTNNNKKTRILNADEKYENDVVGTPSPTMDEDSISKTSMDKIEKKYNNDTDDNHADVNPFIFQSYKTAVMFGTCWFVLTLGVKIRFTGWGIVSGFLWVVGGTAGVVAVQYAGMATAIGTWASVMIAMNFIWGILIFHEPVHDMKSTLLAFVLLTIGLVGMSAFSSPIATTTNSQTTTNSNQPDAIGIYNTNASSLKNPVYSPILNDSSMDENDLNADVGLANTAGTRNRLMKRVDSTVDPKIVIVLRNSSFVDSEAMKDDSKNTWEKATNIFELEDSTNIGIGQYEDDCFDEREDGKLLMQAPISDTTKRNTIKKTSQSSSPALKYFMRSMDHLLHSVNYIYAHLLQSSVIRRMKSFFVWKKRTVGIVCAVINGLMTGSSLIPMHFAKKAGFGGANYMISYATGAMLSNVVIWVLYFVAMYIYQYYRYKHPEAVTFEADSTSNIKTCANLVTEPPPTINKTTLTSTTKSGKTVCFHGGVVVTPGVAVWHITIQSMPSFQFERLWLPGILAGLFLSVAMFSSILAVTYLGQAIGNSVVQSKILISGMWGIFWYKEINQPRAIMMWFLSASCTVAGIIWLSQQRLSASSVSAAVPTENSSHHRQLILRVVDDCFRWNNETAVSDIEWW